MATSLLLLLDDIASVLDDVATMTKVAATKTAGVVGDDLALNAKQVAGVAPARELPVVWAVAMGSALNKAILVPAAVVVSWLAPWAIPPLLVAGGAFLCFEGAEKILHAILHRQGHHDLGHGAAAERGRIKGAIRTDFILSAEIIVITLGIVQDAPLVTRLGVLVAVAILMTIGVYGMVAAIVKLDDVGAALAAGRSPVLRGIGAAIVSCAPWLMRGLSIAGTAAMFLVGGGIVVHQLHEHAPAAHEFLMGHLPGLRVGDGHGGQWAGSVLLGKGVDAVLGLTIGLVIAGVVAAAGRAFRALTRPAA